VASALDALAVGAPWALDRPLLPAELDAFGKYLTLLVKWQKTQRLVGSADPHWIVENLFLDSLLFLRVLPSEVATLADLGSGAGIPGIPIKIVRPHLDVTLVESRARRASFLSAVVRELALTGTRVLADRLERQPAGQALIVDAVVMRCAGDLRRLAAVACSIARPGGVVVAAGPPEPVDIPGVEWVAVSQPTGNRRWFARIHDGVPRGTPSTPTPGTM
jgi:16S rRNA (guanine527-N7)-methyltransferase